MKKTLITLVVLLLATFSASAQIFRSGGIGAYGTSTGYGSKSRGSSSQGPQGWFIGVGGIYNKFAGSDQDIIEEFGGIGGMLEVGKGNLSVNIEYNAHSFDQTPVIDDVNALTPQSVDDINIRAYVKKRRHFGNLLYGYAGFGMMYYKTAYDFPANSDYTFEDDEAVLLMFNAGLGLNFNLGGPIFFIESGVSSFGEPNNTTVSVGSGIPTPTPITTGGYYQSVSTFQFDGIRGGFRFYL